MGAHLKGKRPFTNQFADVGADALNAEDEVVVLASHHADEAAGFLCFLGERAEECIQDHGKRPTFIAVDWWEDGDVVEAARLANLIEVA